MAEVDETQKKIMIAIDESDCSSYALKWALENLREILRSSGVIIFTVISVELSGVYAALDLLTTIQENQRILANALLEKAKELCAEYGVEAETASEMGNPKEAICDAVQKYRCNLLVVGTHGRGAIKRAFLGSVSTYCLHHANCPVLVIRQPPTETTKTTTTEATATSDVVQA